MFWFWGRKPSLASEDPQTEASPTPKVEQPYCVDRYTWHPPQKGPGVWTAWRLAEADGSVVARVTFVSSGSWKANIIGRPGKREFATVETAKLYVETALIRTPSVSELEQASQRSSGHPA